MYIGGTWEVRERSGVFMILKICKAPYNLLYTYRQNFLFISILLPIVILNLSPTVLNLRGMYCAQGTTGILRGSRIKKCCYIERFLNTVKHLSKSLIKLNNLSRKPKVPLCIEGKLH